MKKIKDKEKRDNVELANEILKHLAECKVCRETVIDCMRLHAINIITEKAKR